jgi:hypothetical protein
MKAKLIEMVTRYGKPPKLHYDRDEQDHWIGWKHKANGFPCETSLLRTGSKLVAAWALAGLLAMLPPAPTAPRSP